jgi:hypothetical protein
VTDGAPHRHVPLDFDQHYVLTRRNSPVLLIKG